MLISSPSATPSPSVSGVFGSRPRSHSSASARLSASRSVGVATAVSVTAVSVISGAGSATGAGSVAGITGSGATTGIGSEATEGGPITVNPAPGEISPQVIVQSPALAPVVLTEGDVMQLPSTLPVMIGASF